MKTWYKLFFNEITLVKIKKETDKFVYIKGHREAKNSEYISYHKTWNDAKNELIKIEQNKINKIELQLKYAKEKLSKAKHMINKYE